MPIYQVVRGVVAKNFKSFGVGKRISMKVEEAEQLVKDGRLIDVVNLEEAPSEEVNAEEKPAEEAPEKSSETPAEESEETVEEPSEDAQLGELQPGDALIS